MCAVAVVPSRPPNRLLVLAPQVRLAEKQLCAARQQEAELADAAALAALPPPLEPPPPPVVSIAGRTRNSISVKWTAVQTVATGAVTYRLRMRPDDADVADAGSAQKACESVHETCELKFKAVHLRPASCWSFDVMAVGEAGTRSRNPLSFHVLQQRWRAPFAPRANEPSEAGAV